MNNVFNSHCSYGLYFLNLLLYKKLTCLPFQLKLGFYHIDHSLIKCMNQVKLVFHMN